MWISWTDLRKDREFLHWALAVVAIDLVLIGMFLFWAYTKRYDLTEIWIYRHYGFSMGEGQFTEVWGYMKLSLAALLVAAIARQQRGVFYWGLFALLLIMILSDAGQLHEKSAELLQAPLASLFSLRELDFLVKTAIASLPLALLGIGIVQLAVSQRLSAIGLVLPVMLLGFWTTVVDYFHNIFEESATSGRTIADMIEEGGEGVLISMLLITIAYRFHQIRNPPHATKSVDA